MPSRRSDPLDVARTFRFLRGLARNNDRAWFHAHRDDWDGHVRHAWEDLVTMLLLGASAVDDRLAHVDPRSCIFRLANDTRFHKDRAPYKTWLAAWLGPDGKNGAYAGYYLHVSPGGSNFSAGVYVPEKAPLHALRTTFAGGGAPVREFERILRAAALRSYLPLETSPLRTMPRGFAKEHPRAPLLRARNYQVGREIPDDELARRGALAVFADAIRATAPFVRWLDTHAAARRERTADDADDVW